MATYTVQDQQTGQKVTFQWDAPEPPTDADMEEVFASSRSMGAQPDDITSIPVWKRALIGVGSGMTRAYTGAKQAGAELGEAVGALPEGTVEGITQRRMADEALMAPLKEQSLAARGGELLGEIAPFAVVPGGVAGGMLRRAGTSALAGGLQGLASFVPEGESRAANAALGAVGGAGGSMALSGIGKAVNVVKGPAKNAVQKLGEKWNIPTTLGELTGKGLRTETLLERVPSVLGIAGFRKKQQAEADDAAKSFLARYIADPAAADPYAANLAATNALYDEVRTLAGQVNGNPIPPDETRRSAQALLARYPDIFKRLQDSKLEGVISEIVGDTAPRQVISPVLNAQGQPIVHTIPKTLTFDEAWTLRQGLGEKLGQAKALLARGEVDRTAVNQLSDLFGAVSRDMDNWTGSLGRGDLSDAFKAANEGYKRFRVKHDIIQRAYDKAAGDVGAGEMFSPKKFSTSLKNIAYKAKQTNSFTQTEIDEMTGLANIMQVVKRAGQFMENPPTGNRWGAVGTVATLAGGGAVAGGMSGTAAALGVAGGAALLGKFLTTTALGKRLVMASTKIEPSSREMQAVVAQINKYFPKWAAQEAQTLGDEPVSARIRRNVKGGKK